MKKLQKLVLCISSLVLLSSCASRDSYRAYYDMSLDVDQPNKTNKDLGNKTKMYLMDDKDYFNYNNNNFTMQIKPANIGFTFKIKNNTDYTMKVIWDDSAIIDENNETKRLFHSGTKYIDGGKTQLASIIVSKTSITEYVSPQDSVKYSDGDWLNDSYFPSYVYGSNSDKLKEAVLKQQPFLKNKFNNKVIKLLLSLEINNKPVNYVFNFKIKDVNFDINDK